MTKFLTDNTKAGKLKRTIVQGIIGVIVANLDLLIGVMNIPDNWKAFIVAVVMAILSPMMAELGVKQENKMLCMTEAE